MGLPADLLPYAENFFRRFPEEFVALGMPGLEEVFDLRPNGTWTRHIDETPMEKRIEITIRRWQMPSLMASMNGYNIAGPGTYAQAPQHPQLSSCMPLQQHQQHVQQHQLHHMQHLQQMQDAHQHLQQQASFSGPFTTTAAGAMGAALRGSPAQPACPSTAAPCWPLGMVPPSASPRFGETSTAPAAGSDALAATPPAPAASDQAASRLLRLETSVSALKPQIEALLIAQTKAHAQLEAQLQSASQAAAATAACAAAASAPPAHASGTPAAVTTAKQGLPAASPAANDGSEDNDLRMRRQVNLQIQTCPKVPPTAHAKVEAKVAGQETADMSSISRNSSGNHLSARASGPNTSEGAKPRPKGIQPVKLSSSQDPASPRSPGRYSAWK